MAAQFKKIDKMEAVRYSVAHIIQLSRTWLPCTSATLCPFGMHCGPCANALAVGRPPTFATPTAPIAFDAPRGEDTPAPPVPHVPAWHLAECGYC